jgi:hypothetical protein
MDMVSNTGKVPNILDRNTILDDKKTPSPIFKETNRNPVVFVEDKFEKYLNYHREDRFREDRNHQFFTALDYSQWPDEIRTAVADGEDHRDMSQYNFLHKKVLGFVGMISKNPQDIDFVSQTPDYIDGALLMKRILLKDKELCHWDDAIRETIKYGIIYSGYIRVGVTKKHNELGNIELESLKPGSVLTSPYWKDESMRTCQSYITVRYMTAYEAKKKFKHKADQVDYAIRMMAESSYQIRDTNHAIPEFMLDQLYEQKYRFIEYHHMVDEDVIQLIGVSPDGTYIEVPEPPKALKDEQSVKSWLNDWYKYNHIDPNSIIKRQSSVSKYYVATACHALDNFKLFENDLGKIQAGRLPIVQFSYDKHLGRDMGVIDFLADPQVTFNSRMSMISDIIGKASKDGHIYDPNAFGNDPRKIKEFEEKSSRPGFSIASEPGYIEDGGRVFAEIPNNSYGIQQQATQDAEKMFDLMGELTPQNRALEGQNDSSKETGRLFNEKKDQGEINMDFLYNNLNRMMREIGELWYYLSGVLYTDIYRQFTLSDGTNLEINKEEYTPDGMSYIHNDISMIPRQEIAVSQSPAGLTQRTNDRISSIELIRILPPEASLTKMNLTSRVVKGLDNFSSEDKESFMADMEKEKLLIESQIDAQVMSNQFNSVQAQAGIQQIMQPQQPEQGAEGAEVPPEQQGGQAPQEMDGPIPQGGGGPEQMPTRNTEQVVGQ